MSLRRGGDRVALDGSEASDSGSVQHTEETWKSQAEKYEVNEEEKEELSDDDNALVYIIPQTERRLVYRQESERKCCCCC